MIVYIDLEMLLGLLSITGSAEYLHLEELDEDEVSIFNTAMIHLLKDHVNN